MTETNLNKPTVKYTDDDRVHIIKQRILKWWLNKYHKKTLKRIEKIAKEHVKETNELHL